MLSHRISADSVFEFDVDGAVDVGVGDPSQAPVAGNTGYRRQARAASSVTFGA